MSVSLKSWGRYPDAPQTAHACHWRGDVAAHLDSLRAAHGSTLPFGNGRSYGDSCLAASDHVLHTRALDRFIDADWATGTLRAEAGVTLADVLALSVPRGWFLSVSPGTKFATLGGCVANDVHGKNHHVRGTFGNHVERFALVRHGQETVVCSRNENPELFCATIGGLGLTGVIKWVEIRLLPIRSSALETTSIRFGGLAEFFALSRELDGKHEYSVAWVDCLAKGARCGRGVFIAGNHTSDGDLDVDEGRSISMLITPRVSLINTLSLRLFNEVYWRSVPARPTQRRAGYEPFFYPLDRILDWNRIYGRKGLQQYQCVVPEGDAEPALRELLATVADAGVGSFLAVIKRCGDIASPGLLSFPMAGTSLAMDFPQSAVLERALFPRLDAIVRAAEGRLYPAKDAHMSGSDFRNAYPAWTQVEALRDPALNSRFWSRVTR